MKRLFSIAILLWLWLAPAIAQDLYVNLVDHGLGLSAATNRTVFVTGNSLPRGVSSGVVLTDRTRHTTDVTGGFWVSNAQVGVYFIDVIKPTFASFPAARTTFYVLVTNTTGVIYARENIVANPGNTYPPDSVAWGAAASDARYLLRSETNLISSSGGTSTNAVISIAQQQLAAGTNNFSGTATLSGFTASGNLNMNINGGTFTAGANTMSPSGFSTTGGTLNPTGFIGNGYGTTNVPGVQTGATNAAGFVLATVRDIEAAMRDIVATNQSVFNIVDYGARTNAHMALQICLDKAGTNNGGGGVCFIPAGDWYITNSSFYPTLSSENLESMLVIIGTNVTVKGVGPASKIIVDLGTLASRNVFGSGDSIASGGGRVNWTGAQNVTFMDFTLDSQQNGGDQTQFYGGHTFKFINVRSLNSGADFIDTESVNTTAINCYVSNAIGSAFQTKASTSATAQGIIVGCDFVDNSSAASAPTIQVLNGVSIACDNVDIGGPKNFYSFGVFAGGQFSLNNCYFYPTNGGQAPIIIAGAVGSFSDCTFYGAGSTTSSNYIYVTNSVLTVANGTFYAKDAVWANDSKLVMSASKIINSASAGVTMRGTSSGGWGSKITGCDFYGGSATAVDSSASFVRFEGNVSIDRNILITGGTNSIIANNTMIGTASTRISSAHFNEIRGNIMPVNSSSVHSIMLTSANSNSIAGNKLGKFTFNTACYGNELTDNRIESFAYIGGASAANSLNTGTRLRNMTWTNTFLESSQVDGLSFTNLQSTNLVAFQASVFPTNAIPPGSATVTNIGLVPWRGKLVFVATNIASGGWMWQTNGTSGAPVWGAFNPASQP